MWQTMKRFWSDERGIETVEWALILGIIVLVAVAAAVGAKDYMSMIFGDMKQALIDASGANPS